MRNQLGLCLAFKQPDSSQVGLSSDPTTWERAVKKAEMTCSESGSVSEILKLELKAQIQLRRHAKGEDLQAEEEPQQIEYKVSCQIVFQNFIKNFFSFLFLISFEVCLSFSII